MAGSQQDKLRFVFQMYDANGDGSLDRDELLQVFKISASLKGDYIPLPQLKKMVDDTLKEIDIDGAFHFSYSPRPYRFHLTLPVLQAMVHWTFASLSWLFNATSWRFRPGLPLFEIIKDGSREHKSFPISLSAPDCQEKMHFPFRFSQFLSPRTRALETLSACQRCSSLRRKMMRAC